MKSYTDLEQSKRLAEILPLESADMCYLPTHIGDEHHFIASLSSYSECTKMVEVSIEYCTPCWSLAVLLDYLSANFRVDIKYLDNYWELDCRVHVEYAKELLDACVEMIIRLNELKIL